LGQALFQKDQCIGVAESVTVNTKDGASAPLPLEFRAALEDLLLDSGSATSKHPVGEDA
jgi:hypothetical protein